MMNHGIRSIRSNFNHKTLIQIKSNQFYLSQIFTMVHQVYLFIDDIHFGIAIKCQDGWYKFEYAAGGASGVSASSGSGNWFGKTTNKVTVKNSAPTGKSLYIGDTQRGLQTIIDFARQGSGFHNSDYGVTDNNCRIFCYKLAVFMGVEAGYNKASKDYLFCK